MPHLIFQLRHVPDDEANDIRDLLNKHCIDYYETNAGNWGISMPAVWLSDDSQLQQAHALIYNYQQQRLITQQEDYQQRKKNGETPTFLKNLWQRPTQTLFFICAIAAVFYMSVKLVFEFGY